MAGEINSLTFRVQKFWDFQDMTFRECCRTKEVLHETNSTKIQIQRRHRIILKILNMQNNSMQSSVSLQSKIDFREGRIAHRHLLIILTSLLNKYDNQRL